MVSVCKPGGRLSLYEVIVEAQAELQYDLLKLGLKLHQLHEDYDFEDAFNIVKMLLKDASSFTHAKMANWKYPFSYHEQILADMYDLTFNINSDKKKPFHYPRPYEIIDDSVKTYGKAKGLTRQSVEERLAKMNPKTKTVTPADVAKNIKPL